LFWLIAGIFAVGGAVFCTLAGRYKYNQKDDSDSCYPFHDTILEIKSKYSNNPDENI